MIQNNDLGSHTTMSLALDREFSSSNFTADYVLLDLREKTAKRKGITNTGKRIKRSRMDGGDNYSFFEMGDNASFFWIGTGRIRFSMTPVAEKTVNGETQSKSRFCR
jgi:hypothetical protein